MIKGMVNILTAVFPNIGWTASRWWFEHISTYDSGPHLNFMNYGYSPLDDGASPLSLDPADEPHRYFIQLYHHVASQIDWPGRHGLEIGCGRGGGAAYIKKYLRPASFVGLDLAQNAIAYCREHYDLPGLSFVAGDAQDLQFPDESFDAVVNIESSICYPDVDRFLAEVRRVLKPGGYFLYADLRSVEDIEAWHQQVRHCGLDILESEEITPNVTRALELDSDRKQALIERYAPRLLRLPFNEFAGVRGTRFFFGQLQKGAKQYWRFLMQKPTP